MYSVFARLGLVFMAFTGFAFSASPVDHGPNNTTTAEGGVRFCRIADGTGLLTEPCKIYVLNQSIDLRMNTTPSDAREMCIAYVGLMAKYGMRFNPGWTLRFLPPYETSSPLAECELPGAS